MPRVQIMETGALNAYAAGLTPNDSVVAVTRGLMRTLEKNELEAVIAHELTHIKNRDVRLMVIASIFAGLFTLIGSWVFRPRTPGNSSGGIYIFGGGGGRDRSSDSSDGDDAEDGIFGLVMGLMAIVVGICMLGFVHISALITHFAISRAREFMADGGAVELTKNPDALISALQKISSNDAMPGVPDSMQAMMISRSMDGLLATHPPVENRISALANFAGGRIVERAPARRAARVVGEGSLGAAPVGAAGFAGGQVTFGRRRPGMVTG
jgi:heat shock protein HtpX